MYKVMIVDDVELFRYDIRRKKIWQENQDFCITQEAENGLDALLKLKSNPVDIVITDIKMPKMDGIELLRNIHKSGLCKFVVLLSDFTEYDYARQGIVYDAFDYIGKESNEHVWNGLLRRIRTRMEEEKRLENTIEWEHSLNKLYEQDIQHIIHLFCSGNQNGVSGIIKLIETIEEKLKPNFTTFISTVRYVLEQIFEGILQVYPWILSFMNFSNIRNLSFIEHSDMVEVKKKIMDQSIPLMKFIQKFIFGRNHDMIIKTCEYVLYHTDEKISIKMIAESIYVNKSYLSEVFKKETGMTLLEYITMVKMERAIYLMNQNSMTIADISFQIGFSDQDYFGKVFKKYTGMTVKEFRLIQIV